MLPRRLATVRASSVSALAASAERPDSRIALRPRSQNHHRDPAVGPALIDGVTRILSIRRGPRLLPLVAFGFVSDARNVAALVDEQAALRVLLEVVVPGGVFLLPGCR